MSTFSQDRSDLQRRDALMHSENQLFREFLYRHFSSHETDRLFSDSYVVVASQIDCTQCAACCSGLEPEVSADERASLLQLNPQARILESNDHEGTNRYYLASPCSFLHGKCCSIYGSHPSACSGYPHLNQPGTRYRLRTIFGQTKTCPIVFHVIDQLKTQTGFSSTS